MASWLDERIYGDELRRFRCVECGYGVSRESPPERCPMCASTTWHDADMRDAATSSTNVARRRLGP